MPVAAPQCPQVVYQAPQPVYQAPVCQPVQAYRADPCATAQAYRADPCQPVQYQAYDPCAPYQAGYVRSPYGHHYSAPNPHYTNVVPVQTAPAQKPLASDHCEDSK